MPSNAKLITKVVKAHNRRAAKPSRGDARGACAECHAEQETDLTWIRKQKKWLCDECASDHESDSEGAPETADETRRSYAQRMSKEDYQRRNAIWFEQNEKNFAALRKAEKEVLQKRDAFIKENEVPSAGAVYAQYLYRDTIARFPMPKESDFVTPRPEPLPLSAWM